MFSSDDQDRVQYFGPWADGAASSRLQRDALAVLRDAAERCGDQDMRTREVQEALNFLERQMVRPALCARYRAALDQRDRMTRAMVVREALHAIVRGLGS